MVLLCALSSSLYQCNYLALFGKEKMPPCRHCSPFWNIIISAAICTCRASIPLSMSMGLLDCSAISTNYKTSFFYLLCKNLQISKCSLKNSSLSTASKSSREQSRPAAPPCMQMKIFILLLMRMGSRLYMYSSV